MTVQTVILSNHRTAFYALLLEKLASLKARLHKYDLKHYHISRIE